MDQQFEGVPNSLFIPLWVRIEASKRFPEPLFDCVDSRGLRYAERYVRKTGGTSAAMHFAVDDPEAFAQEAGVGLVECEPFFGDARNLLKGKVGLCTKISMQVSDRPGRLKIIHARLEN